MSDSSPPPLDYQQPDTPRPEKPANATPRFALGICPPFVIAGTISSLLGRHNPARWTCTIILLAPSGSFFFFTAGAARVIQIHNSLVERSGLVTIISGASATCLAGLTSYCLSRILSPGPTGLLAICCWVTITAACNWVALRPMRT